MRRFWLAARGKWEVLRDTGASEIAEAALVLPLAFMMLLGIYWFGRAFNIYATINHAAREGARAAVAPTCATCTPLSNAQIVSQATTAVEQALKASSVDPHQIQAYSPLPTTFCGTGTCTAAGVSGNINVCGPVQLTPTTSSYPPVCGTAVLFEYPYQFWLPFTSLNQQQFLLKADVQMKGEY
jgi:Flp pilus assembly protein TadG